MNILAIRHVEIEHLGVLEDIFRRKEFKFSYLDVWKGDIDRKKLNLFDGFILLGGYMGAYEQTRYPFLKTTFHITEYALEKEKPILGICLGSQILAHVLSAKVFKVEKKEIGWYEVFKVSKNEKFKDIPERFRPFHWHGDTFELPKGAERIFSSKLYENQLFVFKKAMGIQFHLEVDKKMITEWTKTYRKELEEEKIKPDDLVNQKEEVFEQMKNILEKLIEKLFR